MSGTAVQICVLLLVVNALAAPAHANWFGKRGDKDDIFSLLLQQPSPQMDNLLATREMDDETALVAIENILRAWRQQRTNKLAETRQG